MGGVLLTATGADLAIGGVGQGGLEGGPGLGDAATTRLTGGVVEPPGGRDLEEGELTCHASDSTHGV